MLGFGGHFSTKSRRYSTTLGCPRNVRRDWRTHHALLAHGLDDTTAVHRCPVEDDLDSHHHDDTVLVVGHWLYAGRGHSHGQAIYAANVLAEADIEQYLEGNRVEAPDSRTAWDLAS